jgi:uroporphyrinogen decarboxylase
MSKKIIKLFSQSSPEITPPIWLMRQAGRYLPEYRATREIAGGFLNLCYNPELAEEVTLQPIRRYGFDASIVFADILLIPDALGQKVWFETGEGPRLDPVFNADHLSLDLAKLSPIFETLKRLSHSLPETTALSGFAGAPWTVASYMIAGRGTPDQQPARDLIVSDPAGFSSIIDILVDATTDYLQQQVLAGAEILQIFESWASSLSGAQFETYCIDPVARIIKGLRDRDIHVPIIVFPRATDYDLAVYVKETRADGISLDQFCDLDVITHKIPENIVLQGNLSPDILVEGGQTMINKIDEIHEKMTGRRYIFNLGHGIVPQTPPEHVKQMVDHIRRNIEV